MFRFSTADNLVSYIQDFTGSSDSEEIKKCITLCELGLRNIELPALRTDPYSTTGTVGANQLMPIPADMNKPILFFQMGTPVNGENLGPWTVYDRVGDRDIITQSLLSNLYLSPINVPMVIRGKFSEVAGNYKFLPKLGQNSVVNLYYYRAWNLLYTPGIDANNNPVTIQSNEVLATFPEGYVYGTLHEYYIKRHNTESAQIYKAKLDQAIQTVEDQNSLGKWSGGHTKLTSVWQPRRDRQYAIK